MPGIASSAPAVLIGQIAGATSTMRIGSGGVMLPNHAPLVVAEQFGMLEALYPGRIDLGIGRAPGTDQVTALALRRSVEALSAEDFPEQLVALQDFFAGTYGDGHPYRHIRAVPAEGNLPALWLLGSSGFSAQVAGMLGLPFAFAHHFSSANTEPALELYRRSFRASAVLAEPYALIGVAVLCADDAEEAHRLHGSSRLSLLRARTGQPSTLPSPDEASTYPYTAADREAHRLRHGVACRRRPGRGGGRAQPAGRRHRRRRADGDHQHVQSRRPAAQLPAAGRAGGAPTGTSSRVRPGPGRLSRRGAVPFAARTASPVWPTPGPRFPTPTLPQRRSRGCRIRGGRRPAPCGRPTRSRRIRPARPTGGD